MHNRWKVWVSTRKKVHAYMKPRNITPNNCLYIVQYAKRHTMKEF